MNYIHPCIIMLEIIPLNSHHVLGDIKNYVTNFNPKSAPITLISSYFTYIFICSFKAILLLNVAIVVFHNIGAVCAPKSFFLQWQMNLYDKTTLCISVSVKVILGQSLQYMLKILILTTHQWVLTKHVAKLIITMSEKKHGDLLQMSFLFSI